MELVSILATVAEHQEVMMSDFQLPVVLLADGPEAQD